jgi:phosphoribosylglycinamide formyltransferase-1
MKKFVCEPLTPVPGSIVSVRAAAGEPALPGCFKWGEREVVVARVLEKWRETGQCKNKSSERYIRKHWYRIVTTEGEEMRIYFERQARSKAKRKKRWWLYTVTRADAQAGGEAGTESDTGEAR